MVDKSFLDWFAGFVAGEGSFVLRYDRANDTYSARLTIRLRDDDLAILLEIQEKLRMGRVYRGHYGISSRPKAQPGAAWQVSRIDDLLRLVGIFETHLIRARKALDFEIWREAVLELKRGMRKGNERSSYNKTRLKYLRKKLRMIRMYESPRNPESTTGQLELPWP